MTFVRNNNSDATVKRQSCIQCSHYAVVRPRHHCRVIQVSTGSITVLELISDRRRYTFAAYSSAHAQKDVIDDVIGVRRTGKIVTSARNFLIKVLVIIMKAVAFVSANLRPFYALLKVRFHRYKHNSTSQKSVENWTAVSKRGRAGKNWISTINDDLKDIGMIWEDAEHAAEDRTMWRSCVARGAGGTRRN